MQNCAGPGIGCLTDDLVIAAFSKLAKADRLGAGLACKRWGRLSLAPELWREITVYIDHREEMLPRANSFASWIMKRAAGEVEVLDITIGAYYNEEDEFDDESEDNIADTKEAVEAVLAAVAACGRAPARLRQLSLYFDSVPDRRLPSWFATLTLRALHLKCSDCVLTVEARLAGMTGLQELTLGLGVELSRQASLPPSLPRLQLDGAAILPPQVAALPALKHLSMFDLPFSGEGYDTLPQLAGSLQSLEIDHCLSLPGQDTLAQLTGLTSLLLINCEGAAAGAELDEALRALPGLVRLFRLFVSSIRHMGSPPACLSETSRLESLVWDTPVPQDAALPAGPWLARLRQLAVPATLAIRAAGPTGEAVTQLRMLRLLGVIVFRLPTSEDLAGQLGSAGRRLPALQRLLIVVSVRRSVREYRSVAAEARQVAAAVRMACPALSVDAIAHHELLAAMKT